MLQQSKDVGNFRKWFEQEVSGEYGCHSSVVAWQPRQSAIREPEGSLTGIGSAYAWQSSTLKGWFKEQSDVEWASKPMSVNKGSVRSTADNPKDWNLLDKQGCALNSNAIPTTANSSPFIAQRWQFLFEKFFAVAHKCRIHSQGSSFSSPCSPVVVLGGCSHRFRCQSVLLPSLSHCSHRSHGLSLHPGGGHRSIAMGLRWAWATAWNPVLEINLG